MPPQPLVELSSLDLNQVQVSKQEIYRVLPHRYEFERLDGLIHVDADAKQLVGFADLREDDFWVRGHIPGRPLFPGVMMIETAAQLVSYYAMTARPDSGFLGFGAVDDVKFRGVMEPGDRIIIVGSLVELRRRRCIGDTQGFVDGRMVYEGRITGLWM